MPKISFKTIGCRLNQAETQDLMAEFSVAGWQVVSPKKESDVFVINTCSVTHVADRKSRQSLREFKNRNPRSKVVVLGCGAEAQKKLPEVNLVIRNKDKAKAFEIINRKFSVRAQNFVPLRIQGKRTRVLIKIQEGCDAGCTYCVVPKLRGKPQSVASGEIMTRVREHEATGVQEIILTGVHIGQYQDRKINLAGLISLILRSTKIPRIRLSSIEPQHFSKDILRIFENDRICPFIHLPIQSGSKNILQAMGRQYNPAGVIKIIADIRRVLPGVFLSTDIIVGFPGETDEDFENTYNFCKSLRFAKIHVFSYSKREGTVAVTFADHINPKVVKKRSQKLRALSNSLQDQYLNNFVGQTLEILSETEVNGVSKEGFKVIWQKAKPINLIMQMKALSLAEDNLRVELNENRT